MPPHVQASVRDWTAAGAAGELARSAGAALAQGLLTLLRWQELARQRRALAALDDHMLKDIGLSRAAVAQETGRWFWDDGGDAWRISR